MKHVYIQFLNGQDTNLVDKISELVYTYDYYRKPSDNDIEKICTNEKLSKLIEYVCQENDISKIRNDTSNVYWNNIYVGTIYDTIYGDLNVIVERYNIYNKNKKVASVRNRKIIAYSDDMSKIFYMDNLMEEPNEQASGSYEIYSVDNDMQSATKEDATMEKAINLSKEEISSIFPYIKFNPDTVIYDKPHYILKDSQNNITVYCKERNASYNIYSLYMGFE